jgi:hypothetical protein
LEKIEPSYSSASTEQEMKKGNKVFLLWSIVIIPWTIIAVLLGLLVFAVADDTDVYEREGIYIFCTDQDVEDWEKGICSDCCPDNLPTLSLAVGHELFLTFLSLVFLGWTFILPVLILICVFIVRITLSILRERKKSV